MGYEYEDHLTRAKKAIEAAQEAGKIVTEGLLQGAIEVVWQDYTNESITAEDIKKIIDTMRTDYVPNYDYFANPYIRPCKYCKKTTLPRDVGGNNAYYEMGCKCPDGIVIGSKNLKDVIDCWNIYNEVRNDETE